MLSSAGTTMDLLARAPGIDAYERIQHYPLLREAKYGLENEQWATARNAENACGPSSAFSHEQPLE